MNNHQGGHQVAERTALLQVSSVCKNLAQAAALSRGTEPRWSLYLWPQPGCMQPNLSSKLMLRLAPCMKHVFLDLERTGCRGVKEFLTCTSLRDALVRHPQADHPELEGDAYYTAACWQRPDRQAYESFWAWIQDLKGPRLKQSQSLCRSNSMPGPSSCQVS